MAIATVVDPVVTLDELRRRWHGFEPTTADQDYVAVAREQRCQRCRERGLSVFAFKLPDPWGDRLRVAFVCPLCGHSVEV